MSIISPQIQNKSLKEQMFMANVQFLRNRLDTIQTIGKYQTLTKLQLLVRSIFQGQAAILNYLANIMNQHLQNQSINEKKIESITSRIYERCQNCAKPLKKSELDNTQVEIGMKFKDLHSYFQQDLAQMHKLSEESELIFKKKKLNIEGFAEQQFMHKLQKMQQNVSNTIKNVTNSLTNILSFQQKFSEIQQYQYHSSKNQRQKMNNQFFNSKQYTVDLTKHFYNMIKTLQDKLNDIKHYFITSHSKQTQTHNQFNQCTPEKLKQLKMAYVELEIQHKQMEIYNKSLQQQLAQSKSKIKLFEDNFINMKMEKQKCEEKLKHLEIQLQILANRQAIIKRKSILETNQKTSETIRQQLINKNISAFNDLIIQEGVIQQRTTKSIYNEDNQHNKITENTYKKQGKIFNASKRQHEFLPLFDLKQPKMVNEETFKKKEKRENSIVTNQNDNSSNGNTHSEKQNGKTQQIQFTRRDFKSSGSLFKNKFIDRNSSKNKQEPVFVKNQQKIQLSVNKYINFAINQQFNIWFSDFSRNTDIPNAGIIYNIKQEKTSAQKLPILFTNKERKTSQIFLDQSLRNVYDSLVINQPTILENVTFQEFKSKFNKFIKLISNPKIQNDMLNLSKSSFSKKLPQQNQFSKTHTKSRSVFKVNQSLQNKQNNNRNSQVLKRESQLSTQGFKANRTRKVKESIRAKHQQTQSNIYDEISTRHIIRQINQGNIGDQKVKQDQEFVENVLKVQKIAKYSGVSQTMDLNGKNGLDCLPILKKRNREQSLNYNYRRSVGQQCLQYQMIETQSSNFTEEDVKTVFTSIQNAIQWSKMNMKQRKSISCLTKDEQILQPSQIGYMKQFFTRLANMHIANKDGYDKIKLFLVCPYDSVVSQMIELKLVNPGIHSNAMRQSLCKIMVLHRNCTTRGDICKHLRYLMGKVAQFQRKGKLKQLQLNK